MTTITLHQSREKITPLYNAQKKPCKVSNSSKEQVIDTSLALALYILPFQLRNKFQQEQLRGLPKNFLIPPQQPPELLVFLANLCVQMEQDNKAFFDGLPTRVKITPDNAKSVFMSISRETFSDNVINWGRVVSVYTLAAVIAAYFVERKQLKVVEKIPMWVKEFVTNELVEWIEEKGGWEESRKELNYNGSSSSWGQVIALGGMFAAASIVFLSTGMSR